MKKAKKLGFKPLVKKANKLVKTFKHSPLAAQLYLIMGNEVKRIMEGESK